MSFAYKESHVASREKRRLRSFGRHSNYQPPLIVKLRAMGVTAMDVDQGASEATHIPSVEGQTPVLPSVDPNALPPDATETVYIQNVRSPSVLTPKHMHTNNKRTHLAE